MKLVKGILLVASLSVLATSCGDDGIASPFDSKYEISQAKAKETVAAWSKNVDKTTKYVAHYTVTNKEPYRKFTYKADYEGFPGEEFAYVEGSIDPSVSTISDTDDGFHHYVSMGDGFSYIEKDDYGQGFNVVLHYYLKNEEMSFYVYGKKGSYEGYTAVTFNNQGLITYLEWYEAEDGYSGKEIQRATFESLK